MYYLVMRLIQYDFSYIGASQKYLAHCMLYKISCDLACSIGICIYLYLHEDTLFLEMPMPCTSAAVVHCSYVYQGYCAIKKIVHLDNTLSPRSSARICIVSPWARICIDVGPDIN